MSSRWIAKVGVAIDALSRLMLSCPVQHLASLLTSIASPTSILLEHIEQQQTKQTSVLRGDPVVACGMAH